MREGRPHWWGHRERLRERFLRAGAKGLQDYELLELLLSYAIPRKDVKPQAKELLRRFGSLAGVMDASPEEVQEVKGIGPRAAALLRLAKEMGEVYLGERMRGVDVLSSPSRVVDFCLFRLKGEGEEKFMVIYLNVKNEVMDYEVIQEGTVDRSVVYPRRVAEKALRRRAASVIVVHNHPSGHPDPSPEDKRITRELVEALKPLEIRLLDHIIVGKRGYFSFREKGIL
ncbi:MAG: hypothetical protein DRG32_05130 [Deltaproteobacteria bacterium]|nr:MAG: hypothetical protein DRG32_05130 [Deltaproteobacteria bacterium]